ncbi:MAG: non-canonical purine NTP pyrophosphatase [Candidatus Magasanikbacteria bacterium]
MKEILFGTTNKAKIAQLQGALAPIGVVVHGIESDIPLPVINEDGKTAQENARKKAMTYAKALNTTVFSMDNALYFDKLPENEQPGLNVRRINSANERPTDNEMLEYYSALIEKLGGKTPGHWEFAICVATPSGEYRETTIISPRIFVSTPSQKIVQGYPLESIQIDPVTGKYISEMSQEEQDIFWQQAIGKPIQEFIKTIQL